MPRPPLTDEIMALVLQHTEHITDAVTDDCVQRDNRANYAAADAVLVEIRSRLSALEQELEGYRTGMALDALTVEAQRNGEYAIPPECSPRHASLDEAFACERCNNPARVAAIYAKLPPGWDKLPPDEQTFDGLTTEQPWFGSTAIPCTSEYLSAQTGYVAGVPFVERGDESDGG